MKLCVTGAGGFLGSVMVPMIRNLEPGWQIKAVDNFSHNIPSLSAVCSDPGVEIIRGDARDEHLMAEALRDVDAVIPLAALVGAPMCDADLTGCWTVNSGAVKLICRLAMRDQRIIIPITNSGYGVGQPGVECTEETPLKPLSQYGAAKVDAEKAVMNRGNAVALRLATVFGMSPRMRTDLLVNDFVWQAVTRKSVVLFEPHFKRNFIHVRDVALAFLHVLDEWAEVKDNVYNVGLSDANLSKLELCEIIATHVPGFAYPVAEFAKDPDGRDYIVSNAKFERTGWKPRYTLDDGIAELIKGYRQFKKVTHGNA